MQGIRFDGQQEGERVLYEARPERKAIWLNMISLVLAMVIIVLVAIVSAVIFPDFAPPILLVAFIISGIIMFIAWMMSSFQLRRSVAYITDRRVVRFAAGTPWVTTSRALFWDEVIKIKTYPPTWLHNMMNIGYVVIHAQLSEDDLDIPNVSYYRDLGNYLDKVLYLYKREPEKLQDVRTFVPKPRGQRY